MPWPEWQQSSSAVSRHAAGSGATSSSNRSSSLIWPACVKSTGQIVSSMPSTSSPCGSTCCPPWPEKWKKSTSPGEAPATSQRIPSMMLVRVGCAADCRASS
eukprot:4010238-Prymnesium_polylepis.1